jgi:hypothetical protein
MKTVIKLEELAMFIFGVYLFSSLNFSWWWFIALLLVPDISMLGYLGGKKVGAITYNLFHHKGLALLVYLLGTFMGSELVELAGIMLFAHASMDRIFGYGLKYFEGFDHTHLGIIGNKKLK